VGSLSRNERTLAATAFVCSSTCWSSDEQLDRYFPVHSVESDMILLAGHVILFTDLVASVTMLT
jgi:hypothetical protein